MRLLFALFTVSLLAGCATPERELHYWQKIDPSDALYLTGPKAQQMLEEDIAECVHEIIELKHIEIIREGTPASIFYNPYDDWNQPKVTAAMNQLPRWETPERIRELRVNHSEYHDFDGCMRSSGWRRVKYVYPDQEEKAKRIYEGMNK